MVRTSLIAVCTLGCFLLAQTPARADPMLWSYETSHSPSAVLSDNGDSKVRIHTSGWESMAMSSDIVAANLRAVSSAPASTPDKFTNQPYSVTITIKDGETGVVGSATFTGDLSGTLSRTAADIINQWTSPTTEQLHLGHHIYVVTVDSFTPPGPPSSHFAGAISFQVDVSHNPEPSSLVLAGMALPGLVWLRWRRRK